MAASPGTSARILLRNKPPRCSKAAWTCSWSRPCRISRIAVAVEAVRSICQLPIVAQVSINDRSGDDPGQFGIGSAGCRPHARRRCDRRQLLSRAAADSRFPGGPAQSYRPAAFGVANAVYRAITMVGFLCFVAGVLRGLLRKIPEFGSARHRRLLRTTPDHIRAMKKIFDTFQVVRPSASMIEVRAEPLRAAPTPSGQMVSPFAAKLGKQFVVSVEIDPPRGANRRKF